MKARLLFHLNKIKLLLCTGTILTLSKDEARDFLLYFNSPKHYDGPVDIPFVDYMKAQEGKTIAYVSNEDQLIIEDAGFFQELFAINNIKYLTAKEYAEKHQKQPGIVKKLCNQNRIPGAVFKGSRWLIPTDAPYPKDERVKND